MALHSRVHWLARDPTASRRRSEKVLIALLIGCAVAIAALTAAYAVMIN